jgi:hypothetical protein
MAPSVPPGCLPRLVFEPLLVFVNRASPIPVDALMLSTSIHLALFSTIISLFLHRCACA